MGMLERKTEGREMKIESEEEMDDRESIEEVKVSVPKVNNEDPETSEEEIVVSSDDDEDIADETEEKLVGEAFKLLNQFFDKNPELLKSRRRRLWWWALGLSGSPAGPWSRR